ncbi:6819_t:CDS:2 [Entrophospora sp. SA101]|nr:6819_t:CDS:2 [Entrophospora sp. SA101]
MIGQKRRSSPNGTQPPAQGNKRAMTYLTELKKMGSASRLRPTKHTKDQATKEDCIIC